ncbi:D-3-phosphoglycerate dehydrogenase 2 [Rhizopus azygosporus]|uniref:D-3-phosphoglycerate dehydrogenase 2 n=1 Tax=Rhizopus azygosporus TaxID=86630 RepID=A0A367JUZ6_RHIAZ|nr:D-3-phosphoglycerate dehydrogenase 2 [Rhizopus azygosporus]CEG72170.1 Putative 3-phosphoglycerate dehydrogenase [Rhizopus microsporus]
MAAETQQGTRNRGSSFTQTKPKVLRPFNTAEVKVLLLENVNVTAVEAFKKQGYQVETYTKALVGDELIEKIKDVHVIGIRSKTKLTKAVLDEAKNLLAIGCFCIGTNQVDLKHAANKGIAVFNSPFSNSRSVAELVIGELIALARQLGDRNTEMHQGIWNKVSKNCYEIRHKTLGIVGYGHIGSQLSVLAEAMGMTVYFYDVLQIMPLGQAKPVDSLDELLEISDFVSLHVPETEETKNMIGEREIMKMKKGSYLLNNARGTVVQIPALAKALHSGHLAGAAIDVYPKEPAANGPNFNDYPDLLSAKNLIMTPHIGGSTEEAQSMIGVEVSTALIKFINEGGSVGAVNFPEIDLRAISQDDKDTVRVLYIHRNIPGVLKVINEIFADHNVEKQYSDSKGDVAYVMADISNVTQEHLESLYNAILATPANIKTRMLY